MSKYLRGGGMPSRSCMAKVYGFAISPAMKQTATAEVLPNWRNQFRTKTEARKVWLHGGPCDCQTVLLNLEKYYPGLIINVWEPKSVALVRERMTDPLDFDSALQQHRYRLDSPGHAVYVGEVIV